MAGVEQVCFPVRQPGTRRPANNIEDEEEEESPEPGEVQVGTLELNALSLTESDVDLLSDDGCTAWTDWMQDPVMDPWQQPLTQVIHPGVESYLR